MTSKMRDHCQNAQNARCACGTRKTRDSSKGTRQGTLKCVRPAFVSSSCAALRFLAAKGARQVTSCPPGEPRRARTRALMRPLQLTALRRAGTGVSSASALFLVLEYPGLSPEGGGGESLIRILRGKPTRFRVIPGRPTLLGWSAGGRP